MLTMRHLTFGLIILLCITAGIRAEEKVPLGAIRFRAPDGWMPNALMPGQYIDGDWHDGSRLQVHDANAKGISFARLIHDDMIDIPKTDLRWQQLRWDGVDVVELEFSNLGYKYVERWIPGPNGRITYALCHQPGPAQDTLQRWQKTGHANCTALFSMVSFDKARYKWGRFDLKMLGGTADIPARPLPQSNPSCYLADARFSIHTGSHPVHPLESGSFVHDSEKSGDE